MFAVLCIEENKRRFARRKSEICAVQTAVRGGAPFRVITLTGRKGATDWLKIAAQASCGSRNMLLPKGLDLPYGTPLTRFKPDTLPLLIMLNTAAQKLRGDATKRSLIIEDRRGVLADYIHRIVNSASRIRIVTDCPHSYYNASLKLMECYGASPVISAAINEKENFDAAISLTPIKNARVNFSADLITADGTPEIPQEYARLCPPQIDRFEFLCALFECSGVRAIGEITLDTLLSEENCSIIEA